MTREVSAHHFGARLVCCTYKVVTTYKYGNAILEGELMLLCWQNWCERGGTKWLHTPKGIEYMWIVCRVVLPGEQHHVLVVVLATLSGSSDRLSSANLQQLDSCIRTRMAGLKRVHDCLFLPSGWFPLFVSHWLMRILGSSRIESIALLSFLRDIYCFIFLLVS